MRELVSALERTINFLSKSEDSVWANQSVKDIEKILEAELENLKQRRGFSLAGKSKIEFLFLPTGALQEISIDNGWGDEYLKIAEIVERFVSQSV